MPTPVSVARQCLTPEASGALDEAVAVARRRSHGQTTSVHALFAILSFPSSALRDACGRVRSLTYSSRLQFRALELCFSSALDRLPSSQPPQDEPPVSNSFMAAIKRSQANQRRHPEVFHFNIHYNQFHNQLQQQQQQSSSSSSSSLSCVKVELQQLILSILDDPVVSRVFADAGFRSCDLKLAILRPPPPPLSRYSRSRRPPLFLCNLPGSGSDSDPPRRNFSFPFLGFPERDDTTCRRIGEVLVRNQNRNPLLVGVSAIEAVRNFGEIVESGKGGEALPGEISGLTFVSIEKEVSASVSVSQSLSDGFLCSKFRDLEGYSGAGVVVCFGDLKLFLDGGGSGDDDDVMSYVVAHLTKLLELHKGKLWLLGAAESYDMYLKFLIKFPSIEKDWDLQILPITSVGNGNSMEGGFHSRPHSLTESFVPFGGFFSAPSDLDSPLSSRFLPTSRCDLCNEKYEQELSAVVKGGCSLSVADQYQASLPPWMQMDELHANKGMDVAKAKDDETILNAKISRLQKKWNDICQRLNHCSPIPEAEICRSKPQTFTGVMGFPFVADMNQKADNDSISTINAFPRERGYSNSLLSTSTGFQKIFEPNQNRRPVVSGDKNENLFSELVVRPSKSEWLLTGGLELSPCPPGSSIPKGQTSPPCPASVTTDLGLGTLYSTCTKSKKPIFPAHKERLQDFTDCLPSKMNLVKQNVSDPSVQSSSVSGSDLSSQLDPKDFKLLWRSLSGKVDWQNEAIVAISQTIGRCRTGNERRHGASLKRDIWFSFVGPDRVAKKKIAMALAEIIYDKKENLISVDLNSEDGFTHTNTLFGCQEMFGYDEKFRGKMVVDYIAEEISKKPLSVVFLENINKADFLLQTSLSQAVKTGKFSDSRGREISINNAIFVATSEIMKGNQISSFEKVHVNFSEETVIGAQRLEMQILIDSVTEENIVFRNSNVLVTSRKGTSGPAAVNKRKLPASSDVKEQGGSSEWVHRANKTTRYLDLNIPVEEVEEEVDVGDSDCGSSDSNSVSQNTELWVEEFCNQMDETVVFKPFDFAALADRVLSEVSVVFRSTIGSEALLDIDLKVMEQILAAAWLSDRKRAVEDWVVEVLGKSFSEAQRRYAFTSRPVLKLVSYEGVYMKEQATTICLPCRIILN